MPIYEYECIECGHTFEDIFGMSENNKELDCPKCETAKGAKRLISISNFKSNSGSIKSKAKHCSSK